MRTASAIFFSLFYLALSAGCANNPYLAQMQMGTLREQQTQLAQRADELQRRATTLDADNQELQTLLSQAQQQGQVLQEQLAAVRDQLATTTEQLAQAQQQFVDARSDSEAMAASIRRRVGASIGANTSVVDRLAELKLTGLGARADGDVIRIELPAASLFPPNEAQLKPEAGAALDAVAAEIARVFPGQLLGIEGHADSDAVAGSRWRSNHQFSAARAVAVYDYLAARGTIQAGQMFVVGYGSTRPVASNGTEAGRERNRRIELVIYPETATN